MSAIEKLFSDFLRNPNEVVAELDAHPVILRRRGAPALRLTLETREEQQAEAVQGIARIARCLLLGSDQAAAIQETFPWVTFLPDADHADFRKELLRVIVGAAELHNLAPLAQLLHEWRATAEIHADPALANQLRQRLTPVGGKVPCP